MCNLEKKFLDGAFCINDNYNDICKDYSFTVILSSRISYNVFCIKAALSSEFIHIYTVLWFLCLQYGKK